MIKNNITNGMTDTKAVYLQDKKYATIQMLADPTTMKKLGKITKLLLSFGCTVSAI